MRSLLRITYANVVAFTCFVVYIVFISLSLGSSDSPLLFVHSDVIVAVLVLLAFVRVHMDSTYETAVTELRLR